MFCHGKSHVIENIGYQNTSTGGTRSGYTHNSTYGQHSNQVVNPPGSITGVNPLGSLTHGTFYGGHYKFFN